MPSFYSCHFGCRVNEAEKETLDRQMLKEKFSYREDKPDIFIINTCAVTQKAEREARQLIYQTKRQSPKTKIIITGCAATYWQKNKLFRDIPIDLLVDNLNKEFLVRLIKRRFFSKSETRISKLETNSNYQNKNDQNVSNLRNLNLDIVSDLGFRISDLNNNKKNQFISQIKSKYIQSGRLLVKIQDGCQRFCTFCIVPYLRGLPKSITINEIITLIKKNTSKEQVTELEGPPGSAQSRAIESEASTDGRENSDRIWRKNNKKSNRISEVILTAINTEAFGYDTKEKFLDLIQTVINQTNIPRISFGSIHPWSINQEFLDFYRKPTTDNRLVSFLHIPLQSGSNTILRLMKRGYTREEFLEKLKTIEKINPLTFISTDIIVGFLEETDKEFSETYKFLEESPISRFHIFRFSKRQNTAAYFLAKRLKEPSNTEKIKRAKALDELSRKKFRIFQRKNLGRTSTALILKKNPDGTYQGLLDNQLLVIINPNSHPLSPAEIVKVKVQSLKNNSLITYLL